MNNEPVAWIIQSKYGLPALVWNGEPIKYATVVKQPDIPLYTQPAKESDSTKIASEKEFWESYSKVCSENHPAKTLTYAEIDDVINGTAWVGTEEEIRFKIAEAILRKAQEK